MDHDDEAGMGIPVPEVGGVWDYASGEQHFLRLVADQSTEEGGTELLSDVQRGDHNDGGVTVSEPVSVEEALANLLAAFPGTVVLEDGGTQAVTGRRGHAPSRSSDPDTSTNRALTTKGQRQSVVLYAMKVGVDGFTDDDLVAVLGKDRNVCARIRLDVEHSGHIVRMKDTRPNPKGTNVMVFVHETYVKGE